MLAESTARILEPYLAFRHRFRNLYLFDLDAGLVLPLLSEAPAAWATVSAELGRFAVHLDTVAAELGPGG